MSLLHRFPVGGLAWLLAHEIRLFFFDMASQKSGKPSKRGLPKSSLILFVLIFLFFHWIAWLLVPKISPMLVNAPPLLVTGLSALIFLFFTFMLSTALTRSVRSLFERADMDLLLSSPISSQTIFSARLAGVVFACALIFLLFLAPFAHVGALRGHWIWLAIYPTVLTLAVIASSVAMLLTLVLVKLLGIRRTKTVAQIIGALTGAAVFLISQLFGSLGDQLRIPLQHKILPWFQHGGSLGPDSWFSLPARALLGAPYELVFLAALGVVIFVFTAKTAHRFFILGVQQASGLGQINRKKPNSLVKGSSSSAKESSHRFRSGLMMIVMVKEWRLIKRDPQLISRVLLQLLYLLPLFFVFFRGKADIAGLAASMTFLVTSVANSLLWITVSAEDASDLLHCAPANLKKIRTAKLLAAILPALALLTPALIWLVPQQPLVAMYIFVICVFSMLSTSMIQLWHSKPASRSEFNRRANGSILAGILESATALAWGGVVFLGIKLSLWVVAPLGLIVFLLGLAWFFRIEPKAL